MKTYIRRQQHKKIKHQDIKQKEPPQKYRLGTISNTKLLAGLNLLNSHCKHAQCTWLCVCGGGGTAWFWCCLLSSSDHLTACLNFKEKQNSRSMMYCGEPFHSTLHILSASMFAFPLPYSMTCPFIAPFVISVRNMVHYYAAYLEAVSNYASSQRWK